MSRGCHSFWLRYDRLVDYWRTLRQSSARTHAGPQRLVAAEPKRVAALGRKNMQVAVCNIGAENARSSPVGVWL